MPQQADPTPSRGHYAKGIATRQEILDRTVEVLAKKGTKRTSLRAIAAEVGVTHAALTHYFGSLDHLLIEAYRQSDTTPQHLVTPAAEEPSPVASMLRSAQANRDVPGLIQLYTSLCAAALDDNRRSVQEYVKERFERVRSEITTSIRHHQELGLINKNIDPNTAAALIVAASDGLQTQWLLDPSQPQTEALTLLEELLGADNVPNPIPDRAAL